MIIDFCAKGGNISETAQFVSYLRAAVVKVYCDWSNDTIENMNIKTNYLVQIAIAPKFPCY